MCERLLQRSLAPGWNKKKENRVFLFLRSDHVRMATDLDLLPCFTSSDLWWTTTSRPRQLQGIASALRKYRMLNCTDFGPTRRDACDLVLEHAVVASPFDALLSSSSIRSKRSEPHCEKFVPRGRGSQCAFGVTVVGCQAPASSYEPTCLYRQSSTDRGRRWQPRNCGFAGPSSTGFQPPAPPPLPGPVKDFY